MNMTNAGLNSKGKLHFYPRLAWGHYYTFVVDLGTVLGVNIGGAIRTKFIH